MTSIRIGIWIPNSLRRPWPLSTTKWRTDFKKANGPVLFSPFRYINKGKMFKFSSKFWRFREALKHFLRIFWQIRFVVYNTSWFGWHNLRNQSFILRHTVLKLLINDISNPLCNNFNWNVTTKVSNLFQDLWNKFLVFFQKGFKGIILKEFKNSAKTVQK